ncbi:MAG: coenzyme A pyrophosphatase [Rhodobiaceae bacterium]|nr:coenzyme A pyrophosphatase [Rhodobiaceae bacterium]RPF96073.1 MAG: CoA pyrophosphatase [Rhizobiales bacterium TMED227]|tara:strand:+ start:21905 stop:22501 length:597 start_codon:yes stop_codon:yes gene_type:complete
MNYTEKLIKDIPTYKSKIFTDRNDDKLYSIINGKKYRNSAVLIPLIRNNQEIQIILTQRSNNLPSHAGQISFPGGKVDLKDESPVDTAYREANEEIGLSREKIEHLGYLDITTTGTDFMILPVVASISSNFVPKLNNDEVESLVYLPLNFIADTNNLQLMNKEINGDNRTFFVYEYDNYFIWGATARLLKALSERLFQ